MSGNAKSSILPDKMLSMSRVVMLLGSILVALSSGTNYVAYAPQLAARLRLSHTQLNIIGLAGNTGACISGPIWGRIIDRKGPQIPLISASISLFFSYLGIKQMYDDGIGDGSAISTIHFTLLVACGFTTGLGGNAGIGAAVNTTAMSFPSSFRATVTGLVLSGLGLSAFVFSLLGQTFFPGDTSAFLLMLAVGTATPMLIGLLVVRPVALPPTNSNARDGTAIEGYELIPSGDTVVIREAQEKLAAEADPEEDSDSPLFLSHEREPSLYQVPVSSSAIELDLPVGSHCERSVGDKDVFPDIHGKWLWLTPDFYLVFVIMGICSGTGIMYINNVGSISQALYAKQHTVYDEVEALKWQTAQVSILSLGNCAGRVLIGLISDFTYIRLRLPRAYCLCIVSSLFIISQLSAIAVSSVETLWIATLLLGFAYGSLFGSCPATMIEWFGLAHFSENWGYVTFSPVVGGNIFCLIFGHNLDAHAPVQAMRSSLTTRFWSSIALVPRRLPSEHQCFDGRACYLGSLQVTLVACIVSLGLSWWAGLRDGKKLKGRHTCV